MLTKGKTSLNLVEKILLSHLKENVNEIDGQQEIHIKIDNTLTQDATGTMAYLELMSMGIDKVKTDLSVSYVDHNTLQNGFENADDHVFLQTVASKYGIVYSKPGNGICHQLQLERFTRPGVTLLGSDSHTPTSGALGAIAIGAGGLDVALAMAGKPFKLVNPEIYLIRLSGSLKHGVTSKDIILHLLKLLSVKGGVNKIFEYGGEGVKTLSVCERATICNMGAELGLTTSVFPSDEKTKEFLIRQGREQDFKELSSDEGATYDKVIDVDLSSLQPLVACPSQPDNVKEVSSLKDIKVNQVCIGSCTNSSYEDMVAVASILKGHKIKDDVSLTINPGSKQVLQMMIQNGLLYDIVQSGARILECTCGPCIGMGQSPSSNAVTLRSFNRNFLGRSGTKSASIYLASPVVCAASAIKGYIVGVEESVALDAFPIPSSYLIDDSAFIKPKFDDNVIMGPNIMPLGKFEPIERVETAPVILKLEDNISTDHIMPAGAKILPFRSNIEKLSSFCFYPVDENFKQRAKEYGKSIIVAGNNYGQGSSREHAAICPRYLGVKVVLAKSFARIHRQNLLNFGILPLQINDEIYDSISQGDVISVDSSAITSSSNSFPVTIKVNDKTFVIQTSLIEEEKEMIIKGSLLNTL